MPAPLRLLCVLAHPDDESLGCGGILAKYAAEGVETYLVTATRGEKGRVGDERPGAAVVGPLRERELRAAAERLGVRELHLLGFVDGELESADPTQAISKIAAHVRRIRPQVVVTFAADGAYGHPDHVAISQFTSAAVLAAASPEFVPAAGIELVSATHAVSKLYWMAMDAAAWAEYESAFGEFAFAVDGRERNAVSWPDWAISTVVDTRREWPTVWRAVQCHQSQVSNLPKLAALTPELHERLWGRQAFYRVFSLVNGGRLAESDLFAGLRAPT